MSAILIGQIVRYAKEVDPGDARCRFRVLEIDGESVQLVFIGQIEGEKLSPTSLPIPPQSSVSLSDIVPASVGDGL